MRKIHTSLNQGGYTVTELIIVLAIIGLFSVTLMLSAGHNIQVERFSGNIQEFADTLQEREVASFSQETEPCADPGVFDECYWRGTLLEYAVGEDTYESYLLQGEDVSIVTAISDQREGLRYKREHSVYSLADRGLEIVAIGENCADTSNIDAQNIGTVDTACADTHNEVSVAFLGPDGRAYTAYRHYMSSIGPDGLAHSSNQPPYSEESSLTFVLSDGAVDLTGIVTFDPISAQTQARMQ